MVLTAFTLFALPSHIFRRRHRRRLRSPLSTLCTHTLTHSVVVFFSQSCRDAIAINHGFIPYFATFESRSRNRERQTGDCLFGAMNLPLALSTCSARCDHHPHCENFCTNTIWFSLEIRFCFCLVLTLSVPSDG